MKRYLFIFLFIATSVGAMEEIPIPANPLTANFRQKEIPFADEASPPSSLLMDLPYELQQIIIQFAVAGEKIQDLSRLLHISKEFTLILKSFVQRLCITEKTPNFSFYNRESKAVSKLTWGDQDLKIIGVNFTNLRTLEIGAGESITDEGIGHLTSLTYLETLTIRHQTKTSIAYKRPIQITDKGAQLISKLPKLTHLTLENATITANSIEHLASLPNLIYLNLNGNNLGDKDGGYWLKFKNSRLETLYVTGAHLRRKDMINIATLNSLKDLDLRNNPLYPTRFKFFSNMQHLKRLLLSNLTINCIACSIHYLSDFKRSYGSDQEYLDAWEASKQKLSANLNNIVTFT